MGSRIPSIQSDTPDWRKIDAASRSHFFLLHFSLTHHCQPLPSSSSWMYIDTGPSGPCFCLLGWSPPMAAMKASPKAPPFPKNLLFVRPWYPSVLACALTGLIISGLDALGTYDFDGTGVWHYLPTGHGFGCTFGFGSNRGKSM